MTSTWHGLGARERQGQDARATGRVLRLLFWESTIKCNLTCAHCRRVESDETSDQDLSRDQAERLIDQLVEIGHSQPMMPVLVFSGGEPLCRADLFELIGKARKAGIIPAVATNGTLVDAAVAAKMRDSGVMRVSVSLDGATAKVHDAMRRLDGSFERALEGIRHLRDNSVPFQINMTLTKHNVGQLAETYELAKSLGAVAVHLFMLVPVGCGQILAETDMLSPDQYEQTLIEICRLDALGEMQMKVTCGPHYERIIRQQGLDKMRRQGRPGRPPAAGPSGHGRASRGCLAGLGVLFVGHQGDVFPCGYLPVRCGNVLEQTLAEIWRDNEDLALMRDSDRLEGKCGVCGYRAVCGGCRGRAYGATGNYMAEEPFCAYIPPSIARPT